MRRAAMTLLLMRLSQARKPRLVPLPRPTSKSPSAIQMRRMMTRSGSFKVCLSRLLKGAPLPGPALTGVSADYWEVLKARPLGLSKKR